MKPKKRIHDPKWKDSTKATRQSKRTAALNEAAGKAGYFYKGKPSWSAYQAGTQAARLDPLEWTIDNRLAGRIEGKGEDARAVLHGQRLGANCS